MELKNTLAYITALLLFFIPLSNAIPNIMMGLGFALLLVLKVMRKGSTDTFFPKMPVIMLVLIGYLTINSAVHNSLNQDMGIILRMTLVLLVYLLLDQAKGNQTGHFAFIFGVNLAIIVSLFKCILFYNNLGEFPFGNSAYVNQILLIERPYFGFICVLNVLLSGFCLKGTGKNTLAKWVFIFSICLSVLFVFLISARLSIITLFVILFFSFFTLKLSLWKKTLILSGIGILGVLFVFNSNNIRERFFLNYKSEQVLKKIKAYEPRVEIWSCAADLFTSNESYNILTGFGSFSETENYLVNCYTENIRNESKRAYFQRERFNTHNQFLDFLLVGGMIALVLFTMLALYPFLVQELNFWSFAILISLMLFFLFENVLHRQIGCYLTAFSFYLINEFYRKKSFEVISGTDV